MSAITERVALFDQSVQEAQVVIDLLAAHDFHPDIAAVAANLHETNQQAFMPNFRDGIISIPPSKLEQPGVAFIPLLPDEVDPVLHPNTLGMTPARVRLLEAATGLSAAVLRNLIEGYIQTLDTDDQWWRMTFDDPELTDDPSWTAGATASASSDLQYGGTIINYTARPVIVQRAQTGSKPFRRGLAMVHEYVHVIDSENRIEQERSTDEKVRKEARAYHVEATGATLLAVRIGDCAIQQEFQLMYQVEALRQQHCDPERPFDATPTLTGFMQENYLLHS